MRAACAILVFVALLRAQDPTDELIRLTNLGRYQEARTLVLRLLADAGNASRSYPDNLWTWLGLIENSLGHGREAQTAAESGLAIASQYESAPEVRVNLFTVLGQAHTAQGQYREARRALQQGLDVAERELPAGHLRLAWVYNGLTLLHLAEGHRSRAEVSARQALSVLERHHGPEHPSVAVVAHTLTSLLIYSGRTALALPLAERSRRVLLDTNGPEHPDTIRATYDLAAARMQSAPAEAEELARAGLQAWLRTQPERHPQTVVLLTALATSRFLQRDHAGALGHQARALTLAQELWGPEHREVVEAMETHAVILKAAKRHKEASALINEAKQIRERKGYVDTGRHTVNIRTLRGQ